MTQTSSERFHVNQTPSIHDHTEPRDRPLLMGHSVGPDVMARIGLQPTGQKRLDVALASMLADALIGERDGRGCSVSLNKNRYRDLARYHDAMRYAVVREALFRLEAFGLLEVEKGLTWAQGGRGTQTRFRASPLLLDLAGSDPLLRACPPRELIILKDNEKNLIGYRDTAQTDRWRRDLRDHNEAISSADIRITAPDVEWIDDGFVTVPNGMKHQDGSRGPATIRSDAKFLRRIFNNNKWNLGGRSYGHWTQNIGKERRSQIKINGSDVDLIDYGASHIGILYAEAGIPMDGDPYDIAGCDRTDVKLGLLIAINAETRSKALGALAREFVKKDPVAVQGLYPHRDHWAKAKNILDAIEQRHTLIASAFCSGSGLRLQFKEAEVLSDVGRMALKQGIVSLPVHDEIIVSTGRDACLVQDLMIQSWAKKFGTFPVI